MLSEDYPTLQAVRALGGCADGGRIARYLGWRGRYANIQAYHSLVRLKNCGLLQHPSFRRRGLREFELTPAGREALTHE